jgi:mRNA-degrading endonuclease toxin of MazEF toxin-antitoxin module
VVVPCTTTQRGWLTEIEVENFGVVQAHLPTSISVDRIVKSTDTNVGPVLLRQIRELIAELLEL